ncbi:ras association domain-containing protein 7 isoform X1 [Pleurodeles waltl]|uniref:ras association domain-containing protein 7 isoform X1 n=1 Tax=Pleurodeles waltl TaxID=8319 RepID=UPI003709A69F
MPRLGRRVPFSYPTMPFLDISSVRVGKAHCNAHDCLRTDTAVNLAMELKVWVDGVQRVVCGVSELTSCQEVVIALAQSMGQTGRYVLIQTLRDKERQLLPTERPLEYLSKCGQYANDVQFILRRTGPSVAERPSSDTTGQCPERMFIRSSLPLKPRPVSTEVTRSKEPRKALTFNLGPMGSNELLAKHRLKQQQRNGTDFKEASKEGSQSSQGSSKPSKEISQYPKVNGHSSKDSGALSKEDVFRMVLRQQEHLQSLELQNDSAGADLRTWENKGGSRNEDEIMYLEQLIHRNEAELSYEDFWHDELQQERDTERERQDRMQQLRATVEEYTQRIQELTSQAEALEKEIERLQKEKATPSPAEFQDMVSRMKRELDSKTSQSLQLESNISNVEKAFEEAERALQAKRQELEDLNKDLRQCNLQQFILQTGTTLTAVQSRTEEELNLEHSDHELPTYQRNGGTLYSNMDSPPRPTAKQFLGNPRNLQNPLVSSLNPEVLSSKQSTWR